MLRVDRRCFQNFDWILFFLLIAVSIMALLNLYSASYPPNSWGMPPYIKQCYLFLMGLLGILFVLSFDYKELHFWNYPFYLLIIVLLVLVLFAGNSAGGLSAGSTWDFSSCSPRNWPS